MGRSNIAVPSIYKEVHGLGHNLSENATKALAFLIEDLENLSIFICFFRLLPLLMIGLFRADQKWSNLL